MGNGNFLVSNKFSIAVIGGDMVTGKSVVDGFTVFSKTVNFVVILDGCVKGCIIFMKTQKTIVKNEEKKSKEKENQNWALWNARQAWTDSEMFLKKKKKKKTVTKQDDRLSQRNKV